MKSAHEERPVIGTIEVYYPYGLRILPVREPKVLTDEAWEIWHEEEEKLRVRAVKRLEDGGTVGICHLLPSG